ncbi:MAG: hypothetical protein PUF65_09320 [Lachnospiraceae bacterium]|nr:hypothetical protein [Lachnospiraceae bacterium]
MKEMLRQYGTMVITVLVAIGLMRITVQIPGAAGRFVTIPEAVENQALEEYWRGH